MVYITPCNRITGTRHCDALWNGLREASRSLARMTTLLCLSLKSSAPKIVTGISVSNYRKSRTPPISSTGGHLRNLPWTSIYP